MNLVLDSSDQARIRQAMREGLGEHEVSRRPVSAPQGKRWADVEAAVFYACRAHEFGIKHTERVPRDHPREIRFRLESVEGWPAVLVIRRMDGPAVYGAEVTIGRFPDGVPQLARREALLAELETQMLAFGTKRRLDQD